jgi:uncharacterized RDD family membrane protein YckC
MSGLENYWPGEDPAVEACFFTPDAIAATANSSTLSLAGNGTEVAQPNPHLDFRDVPEEITPGDSALGSEVDSTTDSWRLELAARLDRYRTRRKPQTPRYPSLFLPFDAPGSWSRTAPAGGPGTAALAAALAGKEFVFQSGAASEEVAETNRAEVRELSEPTSDPSSEPTSEQSPGQHSEQDQELLHNPYSDQAPEQSSRIIAFPRSAAIPVFRPSGLADPVFDHSRPRIVEAPEILPPPPALGGMLIEPAHREPIDTRSGESPSASVSIARRLLAALVDGTILSTAVTAFAAIFLHLNPSPNLFVNPSLRHVRELLPLLAGLGVVAIALWAAYEFLFVVYTGSTPGLRAARLRLASFDGSPLSHRLRRWRVLASLLSALSVGLGYLWCLLDQDGLCWHDRITRTHVRGST